MWSGLVTIGLVGASLSLFLMVFLIAACIHRLFQSSLSLSLFFYFFLYSLILTRFYNTRISHQMDTPVYSMPNSLALYSSTLICLLVLQLYSFECLLFHQWSPSGGVSVV